MAPLSRNIQCSLGRHFVPRPVPQKGRLFTGLVAFSLLCTSLGRKFAAKGPIHPGTNGTTVADTTGPVRETANPDAISHGSGPFDGWWFWFSLDQKSPSGEVQLRKAFTKYRVQGESVYASGGSGEKLGEIFRETNQTFSKATSGGESASPEENLRLKLQVGKTPHHDLFRGTRLIRYNPDAHGSRVLEERLLWEKDKTSDEISPSSLGEISPGTMIWVRLPEFPLQLADGSILLGSEEAVLGDETASIYETAGPTLRRSPQRGEVEGSAILPAFRRSDPNLKFVLFLISSRDHNGAFNTANFVPSMECWSRRGYTVVFLTINSIAHAAAVLNQFEDRMIHHITLGGHGNPFVVQFGADVLQDDQLTTTFLDLVETKLSFPHDPASVTLDACSTGMQVQRGWLSNWTEPVRNVFNVVAMKLRGHRVNGVTLPSSPSLTEKLNYDTCIFYHYGDYGRTEFIYDLDELWDFTADGNADINVISSDKEKNCELWTERDLGSITSDDGFRCTSACGQTCEQVGKLPQFHARSMQLMETEEATADVCELEVSVVIDNLSALLGNKKLRHAKTMLTDVHNRTGTEISPSHKKGKLDSVLPFLRRKKKVVCSMELPFSTDTPSTPTQWAYLE